MAVDSLGVDEDGTLLYRHGEIKWSPCLDKSDTLLYSEYTTRSGNVYPQKLSGV